VLLVSYVVFKTEIFAIITHFLITQHDKRTDRRIHAHVHSISFTVPRSTVADTGWQDECRLSMR